MLNEYVRFYAASTTASAAFAGLLLIALSVVNLDESQHVTRERRTVLAAGAFLALADIFFVSLVSSLGGTRVLATTSLIMALVGLLGTSRLLPRAIRAGNFARDFPKRNSNLAFVAVAVSVYSIQLILALALLLNSHSAGLTRATAFVIVALFVSALGRAWEVAGIGHRSPRTDPPHRDTGSNSTVVAAIAAELAKQKTPPQSG